MMTLHVGNRISEMSKTFFFGAVVFTLLFVFQQAFSINGETADTLKILALRVQFQEDTASTTTGNGLFDLSQSSQEFQIDPPPHNKSYFQDHLLFVRNYFLKVSRGQLFIEGDVFPQAQDSAYQLDMPMTEYNPNTTPDEINTGLATLLRDAVQKADEDPIIDFNGYQSVIVFHAGVGKDVELGFDETPQDIPSLFITSEFLQRYLGVPAISVDEGESEVKSGMLIPETESQDGLELGLNGILVSNVGSQLGWPDLFNPQTGRSAVGRFGIMDAGLFNGDGLLPSLPGAWTRIYAGWEQPVTIYYSPNAEQLTIHSTLSNKPARVYRIPINETEYFLIENRYAGEKNLDSLRYAMGEGRQTLPNVKEVLKSPHFNDQVTFSDSTGVLIDVVNPDIGGPGTGCLIWHIDENMIKQNLAGSGINANPEHRGVDVEEADGSQDIGQQFDFLSPGAGSETGWVLDLWYAGNNAPLYKKYEGVFGPNTVPNSRSYYNRANSHITISDFSRPDSMMTFRVDLDIFQSNFPRRISTQTYGNVNSIKVSDLNYDAREELILTTDQGKILALDASGTSPLGNDSLLLVDTGDDLVTPPVIFDIGNITGNQIKALVAISHTGNIYGYYLTGTDSLAVLPGTPFQTDARFTTHPVAFYDVDFQLGAIRIVWGDSEGNVYNFQMVDENTTSLDTLYNVGEPIRYLHVSKMNRIVVVSRSGKVYRDGVLLGEGETPYFTPVGNKSVALTHEGNFLLLEEEIAGFAEEGLFRFDSPLISFISPQTGFQNPSYICTGNNRLYSFNYNFTLTENFPVQIYEPDREVDLPLSPLFGVFHAPDNSEKYGIIVTDPHGLIDGFTTDGKRLADFPLSVGDPLTVTPALLNLDGDEDVELAAVTANGRLYVWDLAATYIWGSWNQIYADSYNLNRIASLPEPVPGQTDPLNSRSLMPEEKVYNWPNPNIADYTFIRYVLTDPAEVRIKIYDLAGDLVDEFSGPGDPGTANEVRWNLGDVQSGVYLARIQATSNSRNEVRIIKIAVVK